MTRKFFDTSERTIVRTDRFKNSEIVLIDHHKSMPTLRARTAIDMATRWGMVAGRQSGEDSAGRGKIDIMSPAEVVDRAVTTADLLITEFENRGWIETMPSAEELYAEETDD